MNPISAAGVSLVITGKSNDNYSGPITSILSANFVDTNTL
jgi:hypothetical protein